jgi:hypothetical protein
MKKLLFFLFALGISNLLFAQAPSIICYQGVATNTSGAELVNTNIGVRASFLKGTSSGPVVYTETHDVTTDQFGLFTLDLGSKPPTTGNDLSKVDWGKGPFFLKIEMAVPKNGVYKDIGTSQLLSVPYALNAGRATSANYADSTRVASNDKDTDPTNELQALSYDKATGKLKLVGAKDPSGGEVTIQDADSDPKNELQTLKFDTKTGLLGLYDATGTKSSEINTRDGLFSQPGASASFPQGIIGTYRFIKETESYTVPTGKTFYVTANGSPDAQMKIEYGILGKLTIMSFATSPVLPSGTKVTGTSFTGFEVDKDSRIEAIIINLKDPYPIPANKTLFIMSGLAEGNNTLYVDGQLTSFYAKSSGTQVPSIPGGANGINISNPIGVPTVLTGYLLDFK